MDKREIWQIVIMILVSIAILAFFIGVLYLVLKLNLGDPETIAKIKGEFYGTFSQRR